MEGEPQPSAPAAETASGGTAEPTASAPAPQATGGPLSWEAAFAEDAGASNRGTDRPAAPAVTAPSAASASSSEDGASKPDGASAEASGTPATEPKADAAGEQQPGQREPQPGSRRSTAAELEAQKVENARLREQFETWAKERDEQRAADQQRADREAKAKAEAEAAVEGLIGRPGELAGLLTKLADHRDPNSGVVFTAEDEDRMVELTKGARLYQPLLERARREAQAEIGRDADSRVQQAEAFAQNLVKGWTDQFEALDGLDLAGFDGKAVRATADTLAGIVTAAHKAGFAARDGEVADLKGQLTDARSQAFVSQPPLARGGVSGSGRTEHGYDPTRSPVSNLEDLFAEPAGSTNGRR